jgi:hypothetical protein
MDLAISFDQTWHTRSWRREFTGIQSVIKSAKITTAHSKAAQNRPLQAFQDFALSVTDIPSVEQVHAKVRGSHLHIVTYTSNSIQPERYLVYEAEKLMFDKYPDLQFEFDLSDRRGQPAVESPATDTIIKVIRRYPNAS